MGGPLLQVHARQVHTRGACAQAALGEDLSCRRLPTSADLACSQGKGTNSRPMRSPIYPFRSRVAGLVRGRHPQSPHPPRSSLVQHTRLLQASRRSSQAVFAFPRQKRRKTRTLKLQPPFACGWQDAASVGGPHLLRPGLSCSREEDLPNTVAAFRRLPKGAAGTALACSSSRRGRCRPRPSLH